MELFFSVFGFGVVCAVIALILRQYLPQYAMVVSICGGALLLLFCLLQFGESFSALRKLLSLTNASEQHIGILFKALGICYLTSLGADCCRDAGESALAGKVELAGKAAILLLSLPLVSELLNFVERLIDL